MTKQQIASRIAALKNERRGYVVRGLNDRVEQVDAELRRLGVADEKPRAEPPTPRKRAKIRAERVRA